MQLHKNKTYTEACSLLSPYLDCICGKGFATRKLAKPVGRHIYRSYYPDHEAILGLLKNKSHLTLLLAFDGESGNLRGVAVGAPMTTAFGHPWEDLCLVPLNTAKVSTATTIAAYHKLVVKNTATPLAIDRSSLYELVFVATLATTPPKRGGLGRVLVDTLLENAAQNGYTFCLGEASASTQIGSLRLVQKVYLKWNFSLFYLGNSKTKLPLQGPAGDYFVVGKPLIGAPCAPGTPD